MRVMPRKFVIATMLTAMTGMAGLTAAGTASASTAQPQVSSFSSCTAYTPPTFIILNVASEYRVDTNEPGSAQYQLDNYNPEMWFCPVFDTTVGGVNYYYYHDSRGDCMTANTSNGEAYQAPCQQHPAAQAWHYYYSSTYKDGTLKNYYSGKCLWADGNPPKNGSIVGIGGCTRNQNNVFQENGS
jgi:hypothetical protein